MVVIFDGKRYAHSKEEEISGKVRELKESYGITPKLVSILVGDDKASLLYTSLKQKAAKRVGAVFTIKKLKVSQSKEEVIKEIKKANQDSQVHGVMLQLPLPDKLKKDTREILNTIAPQKDVDGLRESEFIHPTAKAIFEIVETVRLNPEAKVVVVGANGMVGSSVCKLLEKYNFYYQGVDVDTKDIKAKTQKADILVTGTGSPGLITGDYVKDGVKVIDVGAPKGDIDFESVSPKASFITPVPGGVGPVTIACLLENLTLAATKTIE